MEIWSWGRIGWRAVASARCQVSDADDMNPATGRHGLKLNVSEVDNAQDLELALSVAAFLRVSKSLAGEIVGRCRVVVKQWPKIAGKLQIRPREQERMAAAFRLAG